MKTIDFTRFNTENDKIFGKMGDLINERLADCVGGDGVLGCDLHNFLFNTEQAFVWTNDAEQACDSVGVWSAIRLVKKYESDNFGESYTEIEPCKTANMLVYIYGEFLLAQIESLNGSDMWDRELTKDDVETIRDEIETWLVHNLPIDGNWSKRCFDEQVWDYYGAY